MTGLKGDRSPWWRRWRRIRREEERGKGDPAGEAAAEGSIASMKPLSQWGQTRTGSGKFLRKRVHR